MSSVSNSLSRTWYAMLRDVIERPEHAPAPRGMKTRERTFDSYEIINPMTFPVAAHGREFRDVIGLIEGLSMVAQTSVPATLTDRVRKFGDFQDDGIFWGAYGARIHGQVGDVVRRLRDDPDTRQAVLTIFDAGRDLAAAKRDIPCTVSIQFLLRDGELDMRVTMRSNDVWLGAPYDLAQFAILQGTIAQAVGAAPGIYVHAPGSLHIYERDLEKAELVNDSGFSAMPFPLWHSADLSDIVNRAHRILAGDGNFPPLTAFERWAVETMQRG